MKSQIQKLIEDKSKGCGREINHNINNQITICGIEPKVFIEDAQPLTREGVIKVCSNPAEYFWDLCPICKAQLEILKQVQDILDKKEKVNKLTDEEILKILESEDINEEEFCRKHPEAYKVLKEEIRKDRLRAIQLTSEQCEKEQKEKVDKLKKEIVINLSFNSFDETVFKCLIEEDWEKIKSAVNNANKRLINEIFGEQR
jgi:hypothetical protein